MRLTDFDLWTSADAEPIFREIFHRIDQPCHVRRDDSWQEVHEMAKYYVQSGRVRLVLDAGNAREAAVRAIQWCDDRRAEIFREPAGERIREAEVVEWQMGQQIQVSETGFGSRCRDVFEIAALPAPRRRHIRDLV